MSESDVMTVRLRLWGVRVREVGVDSVGRLEVDVESAREWSRCPYCGFKCSKDWDSRSKEGPRSGGVGPTEGVGVAASPVLVWVLRQAPLGDPRLVRGWVDAAVFSPSGPNPRRQGDVELGAVARHHGVGWHRIMALVRTQAARVEKASPCTAVSCVVGGRDVHPAKAPVCDGGRVRRARRGAGDDPRTWERVFDTASVIKDPRGVEG